MLLYRVYAELKSEADRTYLGFLWWLLEPIMFMGAFYLVFGVMLGHGGDGYVAMLLVGLVVWQWVRSSVAHATDAITNSVYLLRQVYIPSALFPMVVVVSDFTKLMIVLLALLTALPWLDYMPNLAWLQLPLALVAGLLLISGASIFLAAWGPLFPDLRFIVETGLLLLMFVSGVFFPSEEVPPTMREWFYLNPVALLIELVRGALLHARSMDASGLVYVSAWGAAMLVMGVVSTRLLQRRYTKIPA